MQILAMDTAAAACSVALWRDGAVAVHEFQAMTRGHATELLPMVESVLKDAGVTIPELDALAVTVGPGGFTGLRIGLASARGFGAASGLPVIGVNTMEALAQGVGQVDCPVLCLLDAKRADLYAQLFDGQGNPISEPVARLPQDVVGLLSEQSSKKVIVAGDSFDRVKDLLAEEGFLAEQSDVFLPDARHVVEVAAQKGLPAKDKARPSALYIRPPDAELPKNGGRLRP